MKNTKIINLFGGPGTGKSTIASQLFSILKWNKIETELVTEFAKDLVWSESFKTLNDQVYIFGEQRHRIIKLLGKVDYIITDCPIILSSIYEHINSKEPDQMLCDFVLHEHKKFDNINIFLNRKKEYNPNGREQTEQEANEIAEFIQKYLTENKIWFDIYDATENTAKLLYDRFVFVP